MRTSISPALLTHYTSGTTTLCWCWKVTRTDNQVFGFTSHDTDILFDGVTYQAGSGFMASDLENQTHLAVDNMEATGFLDSEVLTAADLLTGVWDYAEVEGFRLNWADTSQGRDLRMRGRLGRIGQDRDAFRGELRGLTNAYGQSRGQVYQPTCRAVFGDARCGVNTAPYTVTGTLDSVSADGLVLLDAARTEPGPTGGKVITGISNAANPTVQCTAHGFTAGHPVYIAGVAGMAEINGQFYLVKTAAANSFTLAVDTSTFGTYTSGGTATPQGDSGYFDYGTITMTSGASNGKSTEVKAYSPGTITLHLPLPFGVAAGDSYSMVVGCGKRFQQDCVTRFSNGLNFRGEPHLPGLDKVFQTGGA